MKEIGFVAQVGDEKWIVTVSEPNGATGGYFLLINKYYRGRLVKQAGSWVLQAPSPGDITGDDIGILGDIIDSGVPPGMMLWFTIEVMHNGRRHTLPVEWERGKLFDTFHITGKNTISLQSNLPMLLAKGLKHKRPQWKLLSGQIHNSHTLESIQAALEKHVRDTRQPPS